MSIRFFCKIDTLFQNQRAAIQARQVRAVNARLEEWHFLGMPITPHFSVLSVNQSNVVFTSIFSTV